jgi:NADPH-dependent ferric siderophore reductase
VRSDSHTVASRAGASATAGDVDRLNAFQRLLDDGRAIARGTPAGSSVEILHDALSEAFATGADMAWMDVYRALQIIRACWVDRSATATATAGARVRAFLAENADLAHPGHSQPRAICRQSSRRASDASSAVLDRRHGPADRSRRFGTGRSDYQRQPAESSGDSMQSSSTTPITRRPRIPRRIVVTGIEALSRSMRRITFAGPELETFTWSGPAAHVKLIFPDPVTGFIAAFSEENRPGTMRTYTPRRFDAKARHLQIDFVLHGEGVASSWVAQAQIGQQLVILGPAPGLAIDARADWYVLACDDAALPAVETLLEALPPDIPVTVFAQVADAREERLLPGTAAGQVHWITRGNTRDHSLANALEGCEAGMMRLIRKHLLETVGLDRTSITTRGYWRLGAMNYPDSDYGK